MHATVVIILKRSIELNVLPSDARETEKDVGQVIVTRSEKKSKRSELGCCAGSEWTSIIDVVLSPAAMQTLTCSGSPKKRKSFWQHKLLCLYFVTHMELLKHFAPSCSTEHFWDMQTVWDLK